MIYPEKRKLGSLMRDISWILETFIPLQQIIWSERTLSKSFQKLLKTPNNDRFIATYSCVSFRVLRAKLSHTTYTHTEIAPAPSPHTHTRRRRLSARLLFITIISVVRRATVEPLVCRVVCTYTSVGTLLSFLVARTARREKIVKYSIEISVHHTLILHFAM